MEYKERLERLRENVRDEILSLDSTSYNKLRDAYYQSSDGVNQLGELIDTVPKSEQKIVKEIIKNFRKLKMGSYL